MSKFGEKYMPPSNPGNVEERHRYRAAKIRMMISFPKRNKLRVEQQLFSAERKDTNLELYF